VATLLDIPPTVADLLGIRDPNPWIGSSLLAGGRSRASFAVERQSATFGERHQFSMVVDPASGRARLFDALQDPLQRKDIAAQHRQVVADMERQGDDERQLIDFLLEANLVWRRSDPAP
jgi:arylsulfatase A-like enzyme